VCKVLGGRTLRYGYGYGYMHVNVEFANKCIVSIRTRLYGKCIVSVELDSTARVVSSV
jgi:hypothetical protein